MHASVRVNRHRGLDKLRRCMDARGEREVGHCTINHQGNTPVA